MRRRAISIAFMLEIMTTRWLCCQLLQQLNTAHYALKAKNTWETTIFMDCRQPLATAQQTA